MLPRPSSRSSSRTREPPGSRSHRAVDDIVFVPTHRGPRTSPEPTSSSTSSARARGGRHPRRRRLRRRFQRPPQIAPPHFIARALQVLDEAAAAPIAPRRSSSVHRTTTNEQQADRHHRLTILLGIGNTPRVNPDTDSSAEPSRVTFELFELIEVLPGGSEAIRT